MVDRVHGSIAPQTDTPLVALIDIDEPDNLEGKVALRIKSDDELVIQNYDVKVEAGNVTEATAAAPATTEPEQGILTLTFRGSDAGEESVSVFNLAAKASDFMLIKVGLTIEVPALTQTFTSDNGTAWLNEISDEYAVEVAKKKFVRVPVSISNKNQFKREDIPLPGPGETTEIAHCATIFKVVKNKFVAKHDSKNSHVSKQLMTDGEESERTRIQNHEQGHMDVTSALVAVANVLLDVAEAGKTGNERKQARIDAINEVGKMFQNAVDAMHKRYDDETVNGTDADAQKDWDDSFVAKAMEDWRSAGGPDFRAS